MEYTDKVAAVVVIVGTAVFVMLDLTGGIIWRTEKQKLYQLGLPGRLF